MVAINNLYGYGGITMTNENVDTQISTTEISQDEKEVSVKSGEISNDLEAKVHEEFSKDFDEEKLEKLIQAKVDRITSKLGREKAELQKELDKLKKEKLTDEEIKQLEISEKEKTLAEREQALLEKENRLYAIKAIKSAGLDDGSDKSLELVDFVMSNDVEVIDKRIKVFGELVKRFVKSEVEKTFKTNGRTPKGSSQQGSESKVSIAEQLGKTRAEQEKKSNDILQHYLGGK